MTEGAPSLLPSNHKKNQIKISKKCDQTTRIKVAVRVRPFNERERKKLEKNNHQLVIDMIGNQTTLIHPEKRDKSKKYLYDYSFWSHDQEDDHFASQQDVFEALGSELLENAWDGYNCCIFAYGQTGSGKSYSMVGTKEDPGLIPRICQRLFEMIEEKEEQECQRQLRIDEMEREALKENINPLANGRKRSRLRTKYTVTTSMLEIYNEKIRDLKVIRSKKVKKEYKPLKIREHPTAGTFVMGLSQVVVSNYEEIQRELEYGNKARTIASNNINKTSSRAHTIFTIELAQVTKMDGKKGYSDSKVSKINLIDLAGSERLSKTQVEGMRMKEGININKSLTTLGRVISALSTHEKPPYRDSILTKLLKESLGGNSKTVMLATVSPSSFYYQESKSTLDYASRAKTITNRVKVNKNSNIIASLQTEIVGLREQLAHATSESVKAKELSLQLDESNSLIRELKMSYEEKQRESIQIKEARSRALQENGISLNSIHNMFQMDKRTPYIINICEDPLMNGCLLYYLNQEQNRVGSEDCEIVLNGVDILPHHATLNIDLDNHTVRLIPSTESAEVYVNGSKVTKATFIHSNDRIIFGKYYYFIHQNPFEPKSQKSSAIIDWEFAQKEKFKQEEELFAQKQLDFIQQIEKERSKAEEKNLTLIETQKKVESLEQSMGKYESLLQQERTRTATIQSKMDDVLRQREDDAKEERKNMESILSKERERNEQMESERSAMENKLQQFIENEECLRLEFEQKLSKFQETQRMIQLQQNEKQKLQKQLEEETLKNSAKLKKQEEKQEKERSQLQEALSAAEMKYAQQQDENNEILQKYQEQQEAQKALQERYQNIEKKKEELQTKLEEREVLEEKLSDYAEQLQFEKKKRETIESEYQAKYDDLNNALHEKQKTEKDLHEKFGVLSKLAQEAKLQLNEKLQETKQLETQLQQQMEQEKLMREDEKIMKNQFEQMYLDKEKLNQELASLTMLKHNLEEKQAEDALLKQKYKSRLDEAIVAKRQWEKHIKDQEILQSELKQNVKNLKKAKKTTENESTKLKENQLYLKQQLECAQKEQQQLQEQYEYLQNKAESTRIEMESKQQTSATLEEQLKAKDDLTKGLQSKYNELLLLTNERKVQMKNQKDLLILQQQETQKLKDQLQQERKREQDIIKSMESLENQSRDTERLLQAEIREKEKLQDIVKNYTEEIKAEKQRFIQLKVNLEKEKSELANALKDKNEQEEQLQLQYATITKEADKYKKSMEKELQRAKEVEETLQQQLQSENSLLEQIKELKHKVEDAESLEEKLKSKERGELELLKRLSQLQTEVEVAKENMKHQSDDKALTFSKLQLMQSKEKETEKVIASLELQMEESEKRERFLKSNHHRLLADEKARSKQLQDRLARAKADMEIQYNQVVEANRLLRVSEERVKALASAHDAQLSLNKSLQLENEHRTLQHKEAQQLSKELRSRMSSNLDSLHNELKHQLLLNREKDSQLNELNNTIKQLQLTISIQMMMPIPIRNIRNKPTILLHNATSSQVIVPLTDDLRKQISDQKHVPSTKYYISTDILAKMWKPKRRRRSIVGLLAGHSTENKSTHYPLNEQICSTTHQNQWIFTDEGYILSAMDQRYCLSVNFLSAQVPLHLIMKNSLIPAYSEEAEKLNQGTSDLGYSPASDILSSSSSTPSRSPYSTPQSSSYGTPKEGSPTTAQQSLWHQRWICVPSPKNENQFVIVAAEKPDLLLASAGPNAGMYLTEGSVNNENHLWCVS